MGPRRGLRRRGVTATPRTGLRRLTSAVPLGVAPPGPSCDWDPGRLRSSRPGPRVHREGKGGLQQGPDVRGVEGPPGWAWSGGWSLECGAGMGQGPQGWGQSGTSQKRGRQTPWGGRPEGSGLPGIASWAPNHLCKGGFPAPGSGRPPGWCCGMSRRSVWSQGRDPGSRGGRQRKELQRGIRQFWRVIESSLS